MLRTFKIFRNFLNKSAQYSPRNTYSDTVSLGKKHASHVVQYPIGAAPSEEGGFPKEEIITSLPSQSLQLLENSVVSTPHSGVKTLADLSAHVAPAAVAAPVKPDFGRLIEASRIKGQQAAWSQEFKRSSTDKLDKYVEQISDCIKENKDLSKVFKELKTDLAQTKISKGPFLKDLTLKLVGKKVPFTEELKAGLQSLSVTSTSSTKDGFSTRETQRRTAYCLGAGSNKAAR
jgi:hypothetical protein